MSIHVLEFAKMSWFSILANNKQKKPEKNYPHQKKWQNWGSQKRFSSRDVMAIYHFLAQSTAKCQIWPFLFCDFFRQTFFLDFVSYIFSQSSQISFMRETFTKMAIAKSWMIRKTLIDFAKLSNGYYCSNPQEIYNCSALDFSYIRVSFSGEKKI